VSLDDLPSAEARREEAVMAGAEVGEDKYRSFIHGEGERDTVWRYGAPPNYDVVNKLFEEERTQVHSRPIHPRLTLTSLLSSMD
jgi:hypothetical protein